MAHLYFADEFTPALARITGQSAHHLARVLRVRVGDTLPLADGQGQLYSAQVTALSPACVELAPGPGRPAPEPATKITLFAACPKQDKLEWIIQKAVELGAVGVVPFYSRYCVAAPKNEEAKRARRARIAREAAEQAGRGIIPPVEAPLTFAGACARLAGFDAALLCYEGGGAPLFSFSVTYQGHGWPRRWPAGGWPSSPGPRGALPPRRPPPSPRPGPRRWGLAPASCAAKPPPWPPWPPCSPSPAT